MSCSGLVKCACFNTIHQLELSLKGLIKLIHPAPPSALPSLTFSPETQAPLGRGDLAVLVAVAGVEEGPDADFVLVQVNGRQLAVLQIQIAVAVQLGKHPADGILAAGDEAPVQRCPETISIQSLRTSVPASRRGGGDEAAACRPCVAFTDLRPCQRPAGQTGSAWRFRAGAGTSPSGGRPGLPGPGRCRSLMGAKQKGLG